MSFDIGISVSASIPWSRPQTKFFMRALRTIFQQGRRRAKILVSGDETTIPRL